MRRWCVWCACVCAALSQPTFAQTKGDPITGFFGPPSWIETDHGHSGQRDYAFKGLWAYYARTIFMLADDVHRVSDDPITGVGIGIRSHDGLGEISLSMRIFENDATNEKLPSLDGLLWEGRFTGLPSQVNAFMVFELPHPIIAPRDLWIAFEFDRAGENGPGLLVTAFEPTDQLGWSANQVLLDGNRDGIPEGQFFSQETNASIFMEVYSQPGSLPAPGAGLVLAAGFGLGRPRRGRDTDARRRG